ncbi:MAG TPA: exonuclease domain-containing protein [Ktedonobacteraceae bacterium]|nr:exonuclease domain-containing protein [Ktedonobacteraceae bacterium]
MAKGPPVRVALDLETTGLHVEQDSILEIAAVKFQGNTVLDTLETLVDPGRSIPYRVQRLTSITPSQLVGASTFSSISEKVEQFIGDLPIVGHSIPFDVSFLRRRGLVRTNPLIDTFELATVLLPSLPSYNLGQVAEALGIPVAPGRHRAMVDTILAMKVFLALHERLQTVDLGLLKDLASLDAPKTWPLLGFFRQELRRRQEQDGLKGTLHRGSLGDRFASQLGVDPRVLSFAIAQHDEPGRNEATDPAEHRTDERSAQPVLETLVQMQSSVEVIPEQAKQPAHMGYQTARAAIYQALEQKTPLLMEVTVGGMDYTPALLPVLEWLVTSPTDAHNQPERLVIVCSNRQSARRLMLETLPRLQATLKSNLPVAYLAQKDGYLCLHRWFGAALRRTSGELTAEQARGLAKLGLWAQQTRTGQRSELTLLPQETTAWERIASGVEHIPSADTHSSTPFERCTYRRKGYCFVSKAEERIQQATIVVTTHAGMFDDLSYPHSLLTTIECRLILEADLLEEEIARWSSKELDQVRLHALLNTIGTELADGRYQGLLALAAPSLRENGPGGLSTSPTIAKSELDVRMRTWFQTLRHASNAVDLVFKSFSQLLEEYMQGTDNRGSDKDRKAVPGRAHGGQGGHSGYGGRFTERTDQPLRFTGQIRNMSSWMNVEHAWQQATQRLQSVIELVHEAERTMLTTQHNRHRLDVGSGEEDSVASELAAVAHQLHAQKRLGQQALALSEDDNVYWLRMPPAPPPSTQQMAQQRQMVPPNSLPPVEQSPVLYSQLTQTPKFFRKLLLRPSSCTIFAGAGLSVDNNFSFSRGRFGMDTDNYPAFSVVTDRHEQTLLYIPNDVPEPNMPQYQRHLDEALVQLATALEGQMVVLFTSHASLRSSYATIKPILEGRGILVLAQGIDGSPRQLWSNFSTQEHIIILGAGSFWDSVGEIHSVPACTVITRLPMPVLNDPPVAARAEQYADQLRQLTVPVASLRLRRALNRLAWSDTRRNAIVLFDRRLISKEYGATVLHTLPHCSQRQDGISHAPETILDWLTATGSWD